MISGVIFDMDGLMTDTERLYIDLWCQILRERGMEEHRDVVTRCIGMDHGKMRAYIKATLGEGFDYLSVLGAVSYTHLRGMGHSGKSLFLGMDDAS